MKINIMICSNKGDFMVGGKLKNNEKDLIINNKELPNRFLGQIYSVMDRNEIDENNIIDIFCTFNEEKEKYYCDETLIKEFNFNPKLLNRKE